MAPYIQLVALDLMGTCLDDGRGARRAVAAAMTHLLHDHADADTPHPAAAFDSDQFAWPGGDAQVAIREMCQRHGLTLDKAGLAEALRVMEQGIREAWSEAAPEPVTGVPAALADLRSQGIAVALISQLPRPLTEKALQLSGWRPDTVDALVTVDEVPVGHPAPHMIHAAMALTGVQDVHRVLAVGDSPHDVAAARNSGGLAIGVLTGGTSADKLLEHGADDVLDTAADLPHWIARARVRPPVPAA